MRAVDMDARSESTAAALAVDLDGTLIKTDLLWEGLLLLVRRNPLYLFMVPLWLASGVARVKQEIAARVEINAELLPYRSGVVDFLKSQRKAGRRIVLATGTPRRFAEAVADHLDLFDEVLATENGHNLTASRKRARLVEMFGDGGFDYVGNSHADITIFDAAREAVVVAPDGPAARWHKRNGGRLISGDRPSPRTLVKMLRVHQWTKNLLIAVPVVLSHEYLNSRMIVECLLAFVSFSAAASAIYILNDFFDLELDRRHPTKRNRPFASGALSIPYGAVAIVSLLAASLASALMLDPLFLAVLGGYLVVTTAYSLALKRMLLIDVLTLAGLYTMRILAGAAATGTTVSFWLLAFSIFFFLSLALVKRFVELKDSALIEGERIAGRGYRAEDIEVISQAGLGAAFSSALVLALYIDSDAVREMYRTPWLVWPLSPIILYITMRIWVLARRGEMHEDPVVFIMGDWRSQFVAGLGACLLLAAVW